MKKIVNVWKEGVEQGPFKWHLVGDKYRRVAHGNWVKSEDGTSSYKPADSTFIYGFPREGDFVYENNCVYQIMNGNKVFLGRDESNSPSLTFYGTIKRTGTMRGTDRDFDL